MLLLNISFHLEAIIADKALNIIPITPAFCQRGLIRSSNGSGSVQFPLHAFTSLSPPPFVLIFQYSGAKIV